MNGDPISSVFRSFADLLEYPTPVLASQAGTCIEYLGTVQPEAAKRLVEFQHSLEECSLDRMEELYSSTFDLQPVCCPYVGYHLFGESYKRGAFMAKLVEGYRPYGFSAGKELPDHAAVILRFLALGMEARRSDFGRTLLVEGMLPAVEKMAGSLEGRAQNPYRVVILALLLFLVVVKEKEMIHA